MSNLIDLIDLEIERKSLLKHPFYKSWSEGSLTLVQLAGYSKEYFQLVKQVPSLVENTWTRARDAQIQEEIGQNLREEAEHIGLWIQFAQSLGIGEQELTEYLGAGQTNEALSALSELTQQSFEEAVATMYAYEKELPKISRSKIDGLTKFYGLSSHEAVNYFEIHETADIKHAALWRKIIQSIPKEREQAVLSAAKRSLEAQNKLLDSVMEKYCMNTQIN